MQEDNVRSLTPAAGTGSQCESEINRNNVDLSSRGNLGTSNSCNINEKNRLVRMHLHPIYLWSRYMITPIRHQKQIPKTNPSLNFHSEQIDEWVLKIWPRLREVVLQDKKIQDLRNEIIRICLIALSMSVIFITIPKVTFSFLAIGCVGIVIYAISMYIHYGGPDIQTLNSQRKAILLNIFVLIFLSVIVFVILYSFSNAHEERRNPNDALVLILPVVQLLLVYPVAIVVGCYILIIPSCRDGVFCVSFERQDKALKSLYYQVKTLDDALIYFTLCPSINFDGYVVIDVYPKMNQSTVNSGINTDTPQVVSSVEMPKNVDCAMTRTNDTDFGTGMNDPLLPRHHVPSHV